MHKVKINAKNDWEWLNNFKVLQTAFDKNRIDRVSVVRQVDDWCWPVKQW
jgi:hypothetical protein